MIRTIVSVFMHDISLSKSRNHCQEALLFQLLNEARYKNIRSELTATYSLDERRNDKHSTLPQCKTILSKYLPVVLLVVRS